MKSILQPVLDAFNKMTVEEYRILYDEAEKKFEQFENDLLYDSRNRENTPIVNMRRVGTLSGTSPKANPHGTKP